jgi:hypothetical protein
MQFKYFIIRYSYRRRREILVLQEITYDEFISLLYSWAKTYTLKIILSFKPDKKEITIC